MAGGQHNHGKPGPQRGQARPPLPRPKLPGQGNPVRNPVPAPPPSQRVPPPKAPAPGLRPPTRQRPAPPAVGKRPSSPVAPGAKRPSAPVQNPEGKRASSTVQGTRRTAPPEAAPVEVPAPKAKKEPTSVEELIPVLIRHAVKRDEGLQIAAFEEKFYPRLRAFVPESLQRMEKEIINEYLVDIAHAIYVAIVVGQFSPRPVLCGVRAAELAADLIERVLQDISGKDDKRITQIRCGNLLVGLTLNAVRLLESTALGRQAISGFTDRYERSVITTYGLKTQAEATGKAPWVGDKGSPLDKRIGRAINTMSNVFGDYIGQHGETLDDGQYDELMREFDGFMDRFAPYIEGGRTTADERRKKLARGTTAYQKGEARVEPLEIVELRTRPAGVEIVLADKRILFVSTKDAKRVGKAAEGEVDDTAKRERAALEKRAQESGEFDPQEDDAAIAEIEAQMKANKGKNL
ncbi:MAG: hypothetical protein H6841_10850 [Planctomycetes bacterium]|nr:hypothetical protein [Planctomycetota bacterium]MCB9936261.1 hypothetical protein [Planctomycetota bacterium]